MKSFFYKSILFPLSLTSSLLAQDLQKTELTEDDKRVAENLADANIAATERLSRKIVDPDYQKALLLQKRHAEYLKDVAEGKVRPFQDIVDNWVVYESQLKSLSDTYERFLSTDSKEDEARIIQPLLIALQPLGNLLRDADHRGARKRVLSEDELDQQDTLMNKFNTLRSSDDDGMLKLLTANSIYTLRHVPVAIDFSAPAGTEIMLQSELGGEFPNRLDYIIIVADNNGIASTSWVSHGDGAAECNILFRSPEYPTKGMIRPVVKKLELYPLEQISPVVKITSERSNEALQELKAKRNNNSRLSP